MATLAPRIGVRSDQWFYVGMAVLFAVIAFGGFIPTYWAKMATGSFTGNPVMHVHGLFFFGWTLLYFTQTLLVATHRAPLHRSLGLLGIALVSGMAFTVVLASINEIKVAEAIGVGDNARRFVVVPLLALPLFTGFFAAAIANVRRPELHKRLMILTMIPLMHAAIARVFMLLFAPPGAVGPPPVLVAVPPGFAALALLAIPMVHDWRRLGHVPRVYVIGGALMLAYTLLLVPVGNSTAWMTFAHAVESLAG
ncbi:MAG TPA: hypothetical protein PK808_05825 [Polymorphobacter sp.]|nr:hypothetical protein [Polymorphobacter sp.]